MHTCLYLPGFHIALGIYTLVVCLIIIIIIKKYIRHLLLKTFRFFNESNFIWLERKWERKEIYEKFLSSFTASRSVKDCERCSFIHKSEQKIEIRNIGVRQCTLIKSFWSWKCSVRTYFRKFKDKNSISSFILQAKKYLNAENIRSNIDSSFIKFSFTWVS